MNRYTMARFEGSIQDVNKALDAYKESLDKQPKTGRRLSEMTKAEQSYARRMMRKALRKCKF